MQVTVICFAVVYLKNCWKVTVQTWLNRCKCSTRNSQNHYHFMFSSLNETLHSKVLYFKFRAMRLKTPRKCRFWTSEVPGAKRFLWVVLGFDTQTKPERSGHAPDNFFFHSDYCNVLLQKHYTTAQYKICTFKGFFFFFLQGDVFKLLVFICLRNMQSILSSTLAHFHMNKTVFPPRQTDWNI